MFMFRGGGFQGLVDVASTTEMHTSEMHAPQQAFALVYDFMCMQPGRWDIELLSAFGLVVVSP